MRVTPDLITELKEKEIFVFGSNESGRHGKGAAKTAMKWGAIYGQAKGIQGRTYGIPTVNAFISNKLKLSKVEYYVNEFYLFCIDHPHRIFLVTEIGCGLAGFTVKEIAPLFKKFVTLDNVYLPKRFLRVIKNA
jgi:hypothetical protein